MFVYFDLNIIRGMVMNNKFKDIKIGLFFENKNIIIIFNNIRIFWIVDI